MNNETQVSIKFTNSVTGQKKLEQYAETLKKINTFFNSIDSSKAKEIDKYAKNTSNTNFLIKACLDQSSQNRPLFTYIFLLHLYSLKALLIALYHDTVSGKVLRCISSPDI